MTIPYFLTASGVIMYIKGKSINYASDAPHYQELARALQAGASAEDLLYIMNKEESKLRDEILAMNDPALTYEDGKVKFHDEVLTGKLLDYIQEATQQGYPLYPLVNFLYNLWLQPNLEIRAQLFDVVSLGKCPLTEDGSILAYLPARADYTDVATGKLDFSCGQYVSVNTRTVGTDLEKSSMALYSFEGLNDEMVKHPNARAMVAAISPQDVVLLTSERENPSALFAATRMMVTAEYLEYRTNRTNVLAESSVIDYDHDEIFTIEGIDPLTREWLRISGANTLSVANSVMEEELAKPTYLSLRIVNNQGGRVYAETPNGNYKEPERCDEHFLHVEDAAGNVLRSEIRTMTDAIIIMDELCDDHPVLVLKDASGKVLQRME